MPKSSAKVIRLPSRVLGTKRDPDTCLVPYGEIMEGALRPCRHCGHWFSYLGRPRHEAKCWENPANRKRKVR